MNHSNSSPRWLRHALVPFTLISLFTLLISLALASPAFADPPGRIGRVAWVADAGTLTLANRETGESLRAPINQPLTSGDIVSTDANGRAEIQIGSMTVRLDADSSLELTRIDDEQVSLFLKNGRSIVKLPSPETAREFELNTPDGRFSARETGVFRFETDADRSGSTAYFGTLHFESDDNNVDIKAGEHAEIWYSGQTRYRIAVAAGDEFSHWSAARDQRLAENARTNTYTRYVSPEMTGAEDLDAYGNWSETPDYGAIWIPRAVAADWAPYRSGRWVWVAPWGWSWVGNEPWGFAPFHYGRWVQHHGHWAWVPGTRVARPAYAPAMVAWIGTPGLSVTISSGRAPTVGWFPLAPREVYVPTYRTSANYVRHVNVTHVRRIDNAAQIASDPHTVLRREHYAHRDMPRAVSTAPADDLTRRPSSRIAQPSELPTRHSYRREPPTPRQAPTVKRVETRMLPDREVRTERVEHSQPMERTERDDRGDRGDRPDRAERPRSDSSFVRREHEKDRSDAPTRMPAPSPTAAPVPVAVVATTPAMQNPSPERQFPVDRERHSNRFNPPAAAEAPAPAPVAAQRTERPTPEVSRQTPERAFRRDEPAQAQNREVRNESPRQARQDAPARAEGPPPSVRNERPQPQTAQPTPHIQREAGRPDDRRPASPEDELRKRRHRQDEPEKR